MGIYISSLASAFLDADSSSQDLLLRTYFTSILRTYYLHLPRSTPCHCVTSFDPPTPALLRSTTHRLQ